MADEESSMEVQNRNKTKGGWMGGRIGATPNGRLPGTGQRQASWSVPVEEKKHLSVIYPSSTKM